MRSLTTIEGKSDAESFVAYLLTLGISTHVEPVSTAVVPGANASTPDSWEVWIKNEDRLDQAKQELAEFHSNPKDPKYATALRM